MQDLKGNIFKQLYPDVNGFSPARWLEEEVNELALKYSGLDEMPLQAAYPLVYLYLNGPTDAATIAESLELELSVIINYLEHLCCFKFAEDLDGGFGDYQLTEKGIDTSISLGRNVIIRKRFELKSHLKHLDRLFKNLDAF